MHCQMSKLKRLDSLKQSDDLVVANPQTLVADPVEFLAILDALLLKGVCIHFVEDGLVMRGNAHCETNKSVKSILSLVSGLPSSHQSASKEVESRLSSPKGLELDDASLLSLAGAVKH